MTRFALWWNAFGTRLWYGLTQFFTGFGGVKLRTFAVPNEIVADLDHGQRYRADRRAGAMTHPRKVQARINAGQKLGDCEDHAGYWIAALLESGLATEVYMGSIFYLDGGKKEGHAVTVFKRDGEYFWADYAQPQMIATRDAWVAHVLTVYGDTLRGAYLFKATLGARGQVKFGRTLLHPAK